jgi:hypothetical protein
VIGQARQQALRAALPAGAELRIDAATAGTTDMTARMNLDYVVSVVLNNVTRARSPLVTG